MDDIRWFGSTPLFRLPVPALRQLGLLIATEGNAPAALVLAMDNDGASSAWRFGVRHRCPVIQYVWDLPPWRLGGGKYDPMWSVRGRLLRLPRVGRRYAYRRSYYSRLRFVAAHARAVWVPSEATAADVRTRFGVAPRRVPYCYDSELFVPGERRGGEGAPLLSVSRLVPAKNHEAVIRVAQRLGRSVRLIGRGSSHGTLEALARRLGVRCAIESGLTGDELRAAYLGAAVVVCPSRFEGLGLTGIEAAACGAPVVASSIPPHREFLGGAAHFFALDDDDDLLRAIQTALGSPPRVGRFEEITIPAAARRFHELLTAQLPRRRNRGRQAARAPDPAS
jgi:glycosyltransferase involved in cell wall biosynthesis